MYSLWIVQWDFTRRDHLENSRRVSGSGLVIGVKYRDILNCSSRLFNCYDIFCYLSIVAKKFLMALYDCRDKVLNVATKFNRIPIHFSSVLS